MGHHHTPRATVNYALVMRGLAPIPQPFVCPCCCETLDRDDQGDADFFVHSDKLIERYGEMPCAACADEAEPCSYCGTMMAPTDVYDRTDDMHQDKFCSRECKENWWRDAG